MLDIPGEAAPIDAADITRHRYDAFKAGWRKDRDT